MKTIKEINPGDTFRFNNDLFIMTCDFKDKGQRLCYNLKSGNPFWLDQDTGITTVDLFIMDENNNILSIK